MPAGHVSLPMGALDALRALDARLNALALEHIGITRRTRTAGSPSVRSIPRATKPRYSSAFFSPIRNRGETFPQPNCIETSDKIQRNLLTNDCIQYTLRRARL